MGRRTPRHRGSSGAGNRPGRSRALASAVLLAAVAVLLIPATTSAHPLGNFTINHYAALTIRPDRVDLDVVIDMAEIPAFQERQAMDTDADGSISDAEAAAWGRPACTSLGTSLRLARDGAALTPEPARSAVSFPPGAGGLSTLRLECGYAATIAAPTDGSATITFSDASYAERIGWREVVASGDGTIIDSHGLPATSPSRRLTAYPAAMIAQPLDVRTATISVRPDPRASAGSPPSGQAPPSSATGAATDRGATGATPAPPDSAIAAVPGGVASELPDIFRTRDLTPFVLLLSLAAAIGLGAGHALTPGHGKTLMAAYLVGSRGTSIHAVGLGLSVAVSHTLGIFALALLIVGAQGVLPPDVVVRATPVIAAVSIVVIGGWMLIGEIRRRRVSATAPLPAHADHHDHGAGHDDATGRDHGAGHHHATGDELHSHGGISHTHLPPAGATLSWRGLFVLGLAGGLIPSTSALLILLGSIAAGRPAFGLVLVIAFGLGMAAVMTAVGLAMILARTRLDRMPSGSSLGRLATAAPLVASIAVLGLGVVLTWSAVAGRPVL